MRRTTPIIIFVIAVLFLIVDFWPRLTIPNIGDPNGGTRAVETKLGLDLVGGLQVEYRLLPVGDRQPDAGALSTTKSIIENRVNSTGVAEPVVQTQGADRVIVELPNAKNPDEIRALLVQTGKLDFIPLPVAEYGNQGATGTYQAVEGQPLPTTETPLFGGEQIDQAFPSTDATGLRAVGFRLKSQGSQLFGDYTSKHVGEFFAIVLDGKVVSAPVIQNAITGGQGIITGGSAGGFSAKDMNSLITVLNYGSLPFPLKEESSTEIGATLAGFSLDRILFAGLIAILLVFLFMLVYYRLPGAVACFALLYYAIVVLALFRLIPVTLTLAGIAGFILSVGMAVDANILIFERTKEELRSGKPINSAMEAGFNRAWNSILDSNVSSLITATILYVGGSSTIRGFALVLIIGVLVSMFTAITVSRTVLRWVVRQPWARQARYFGVEEDEFVVTAPQRRSRQAGARV
ncbi:MAG: protein translocase subunit SecD [Candidatus Limnocylindrales bacterium]